MDTKQIVLFKVASTLYKFQLEGNALSIQRKFEGWASVDLFHVDEDPMDMVVDEIVMDLIEWCAVDIDTDNEVQALTDQVYIVVTMFYALRTLQIVKGVE